MLEIESVLQNSLHWVGKTSKTQRPSTFCKVSDFVPLGGQSIGASQMGESEKWGFGGLFCIF